MEFLGGVIAGVLVAVLVQLVVGVYIQPALQLREAIWAVDHSLIQYGNAYGKLAPEWRKVEAQARFRDHAGALHSKAHVVMVYSVWAQLRLLPKRKSVVEAKRKLIYLSNLARDLSEDAGLNASDAEKEIRKLLDIETDPTT